MDLGLEKSYYERTNYPNLYKDVYWGTYKNRDIDEIHEMQYIFENRNKFAETFKLKRVLFSHFEYIDILRNYVFHPDDTYEDICYILQYNIQNNIQHHSKFHTYEDHVEIYETTDDKIVFITSPYNINKNDLLIPRKELLHTFLNDKGFIAANDIYTLGTISLYKVYTKYEVKSLKSKLKQKQKLMLNQTKEKYNLKSLKLAELYLRYPAHFITKHQENNKMDK